MGLRAKLSSAFVLLNFLCLLAPLPPPVSGKLKTFTMQNQYFKNNFDYSNVFEVVPSAKIGNNAFQVTPDSGNPGYKPTYQSGRVLYKFPFKLWEGRNDTYTDRVASFNASFLVNLNRLGNSTPGEGLAFVVAPDLNIPPNSFGEYLGLTNSTTDGNSTNLLIAIELDTFKQHFDPDSKHVGLNINSVRSNKTTSLTPLGFELVSVDKENFFNVWVQYDGIKRVIDVYIAEQANKTNPTPPRPANPILTSNLELRGVVNQHSYFGFSASTSNATQLNSVLRWNLTVEYYNDDKELLLTIYLAVGIPIGVVLVAAAVVLWYYLRKRVLSRSKTKIEGALKNLPGTPKEFKFKDLKKATNSFDKKNKLGQGGFGEVYKGHLANDNSEVAVKKFSREALKGEDDFLAELTIINRLRHKNLVPLLGWCHNHLGNLLLVYEYMPNGSLDKHLFGELAESKPLAWSLRQKIISGIASALHYLHEEYDKRVIHRDLKPSNIMLDFDFNARLGDFGLARAIDNSKSSYAEANGVMGTLGYIAPECFRINKTTQQSDVYAFGAVMLEVVCGLKLGTQIGEFESLVNWVWSLHHEDRLLEAVDKRLMEDYVMEEARRILILGLACLNRVASKRPTTQNIVQILSGSVPEPHVLLFKPMGEKDVSQATATRTRSRYGSSRTPLAMDPKTHGQYSDKFNSI